MRRNGINEFAFGLNAQLSASVPLGAGIAFVVGVSVQNTLTPVTSTALFPYGGLSFKLGSLAEQDCTTKISGLCETASLSRFLEWSRKAVLRQPRHQRSSRDAEHLRGPALVASAGLQGCGNLISLVLRCRHPGGRGSRQGR